jgi:hypothetical protein
VLSRTRKATQILNRLFRSFSDSYFWSIVTIWIIALMIFSATVFPALGSSMNRVSLEFKGKSTPVLELKADFPEGWDTRFYSTFLNNQSLKGSFDPWAGYWKYCLTEGDAKKIEQLDGVESVVRVIDLDARVRPEVLPKFLVESKKLYIDGMISGHPEYFERKNVLNLAASWNMTPVEYMNMTTSYYGMVTRCIESDKIAGWKLLFGEEALAGIPKENLNNSIIVKEYMLHDEFPDEGYRLGEKAYFLTGQAGSYCPGSPVWSTAMEINGTSVSYDRRHLYSFNVTSSIPSVSVAWNAKEPGIVADLDAFLRILDKERNPDGAPLPIYTSLLVKPTSPTDYVKVEGYLRGLYPGKTVSRAGTAPLSIDEKAAQASTEFYGMAYLYTSASAGLGVAVLFVEAVRNRKMLWLLRSRGWTRLDILSYCLAKAALLGVASGVLAALTIEAAKPLIIDSLAPQALMNASPTIAPLVSKAMNESISIYMIFVLPLLGITATVLCSVASTIYSLVTKPKGNLYDATAISVNRP